MANKVVNVAAHLLPDIKDSLPCFKGHAIGHLCMQDDAGFGSGFVGWQRQAAGRSVQGEVEAVLEKLNGRRIPVHAAGRTDAGVHARGMGISLTVPARWSGETLKRALNALLPRDCWIERMDEMLARPTHDPQGDPIPDAEGAIAAGHHESLLTCPVATPARY